MSEAAGPAPEPVAWWRPLLVAGLLAALYVALLATASAPHVHPVLLLPAALLGSLVGHLTGRWESAGPRPSRRSGHRARGRRTLPATGAGWWLSGLVGIALVLARSLSPAAMAWLLLGGVALMVGGAAHARVVSRDRATAAHADH